MNFLNNFTKHPLIVLAFHGVVHDRRDALDDFCFVEREKVISTLALFRELGWKFKSLQDGLLELSELRLSGPTVAITFDDGFSSVLKIGEAILSDFGACATVFLPTRVVQQGERLWFTKVIECIKKTDRDAFRFLGRKFGLSRYSERVFASQMIQGFLKNLHPEAINIMILELARELRVSLDQVDDTFQLLSWQECLRASENGSLHFGAHSATHSIHSVLSHSERKSEIGESLAAIRPLSNNSPLIYAFPNGQNADFTSSCHQLLNEMGAFSAVSTIPGWNLDFKNRFSVRRFCIGPMTEPHQLLSAMRWRLLRAVR